LEIEEESCFSERLESQQEVVVGSLLYGNRRRRRRRRRRVASINAFSFFLSLFIEKKKRPLFIFVLDLA